jgi:hypothetical protein
MSAHDGVVGELERRILEPLAAVANRLREEYPHLNIRTWSSSTGSRTEYQGHDVGIECLDPHASPSECDNVALIIGVKHLTTVPLLSEAYVGWGAGGPTSGLDVLPEPVPWSDEALQQIVSRLPDLVDSLTEELNRFRNSEGRGRPTRG